MNDNRGPHLSEVTQAVPPSMGEAEQDRITEINTVRDSIRSMLASSGVPEHRIDYVTQAIFIMFMSCMVRDCYLETYQKTRGF